MTEIKSSYEKAMERFKDVQPDTKSLKRKELVDKGRLLCTKVFVDTSISIEKELSSYREDEREFVRNGLGEALLMQVALPANEAAMNNIDTIKTIAMTLAANPAMVEQLIKQYRQVCQQYFEENIKFTEQLQAQLAQIQQQAQGNPAQMQNLQARLMQSAQEQRKELLDHFGPVIKKVRSHLRQLCGFALEK